jgi:hypothetical protein
MTTYTTPHFANGPSDRNVRPASESLNRARPAPAAATHRTAGVSNEGAALAQGPTPDWQPGAAKGGVPKAAIGALGAALVGGVALAIVLMAPSNKVSKQVASDPIAQNAVTQKSVDSTDAAVKQLDDQAPAAGAAADATAAQQRAQDATDAAQPAAAPAVIPQAAPVANAPVARMPRHTVAPVAPPRVAPQPVQTQEQAPVVAPAVQAQPQAPAMQQIPDAPTVTPSVPTPAPADPAPAPATPDPAPAQ